MIIVLYTEGLPFTGDTLEHQALGGSETAFICVARELARAGHEVHAYCACSRPGIFDGVCYRHAAGIREWEQRECDLFLCSRFFPVFRLNLRAKARFLWMHDVLAEPWTSALLPLLGRIDAIYCLSQYHAALVAAALPAAKDLIRISSNGVDLALVASATNGVRKRRRIMYTSRAERGLREAIDAYAAMNDPSLEFLYSSYKPLPDPHVQALESECAARMQAFNARGFSMRAGSFARRDLYRLIAESFAIIYPSSFPEVSCISAMEAQACGTVFLTVDDFALRETVGYERVPSGDPTAFADRLRTLLDDAQLRARLEETGRRHVAQYTWERVARAFLEGVTKLRHATAVTPRFTPSRKAPITEVIAAAEERIAHEYRDRRRTLAPKTVNGTLPKISCLTVTYNRLLFLKQAIRSYCDQTWPNRELLIVTDGEPRFQRAIENHVATLGRDDIRLVFFSDRKYTLGALRNFSLQAAKGDLICQWDDDDSSHPDRLTTQASYLLDQRADACFLTDHLHFFYQDRVLLWIDWTYGGRVHGKWQLAPGTLMIARDSSLRYPEAGPESQRGEDSALIDSFYGRLKLARLSGMGQLYLYTYHGRNTFPEEHHRGLGNAGAPAAFIRPRERAMREALRYYTLPRPIIVRAHPDKIYSVEGS